MRERCTNVAAVKNVRQLNSISGGSGKAELLGRDEFTAHIVRECWDDGEGSGQHVRVGVRDANREKEQVSTRVNRWNRRNG